MAAPRRLRPLTAPDDPAFRQLKAAVVARTGHHYYVDKDDLLWERVARRLAVTGLPHPEAYLARLDESGRGEAEWQALEAEITIGETYFFRYVEQFEAIRCTILPDLIRRNRPTRRLRIWSAGSSNGSEAYTLAILLYEAMARELGDEAADWRVGIVGTDISEPVLAAARQATFGPWALRSLGPEEVERWFLPAGSTGPWTVRPEFRALVHFERHNLITLVEGIAPLQFTGFDLVLCRNVLIYFDPNIVPSLVAALGEALAPGGWLLLGHAEPNVAFGQVLEAVELPGTVAYRPKVEATEAAESKAPVPPDVVRAVEPAASAPLQPVPRKFVRPVTPALPTPLVASADGLASDLAEVRALADAGKVEAALARVQAGLAAHPLDPGYPFLEGLIAAQLNRPAEAAAALGRAVYLDSDFVMAHYHLALALMASGPTGRGRRVMAHVARLTARLASQDDRAELPWGDGLTASDLAASARRMLDAAPAVDGRR